MHTVKITKIVLKNFIGIKSGLGKSELSLDISKLENKNIICILGDNGTGKTTLSSVLHPLPGTTDKRNKFIIEDKEGLKKIYYDRSDGCKYECKIVYSPSKTGHTSKGFIKKITKDGEEIELNPNGNISSYKDAVFDELGCTEATLKLANQNDVCKGHVDMTSTERKVNMSTFLPEDIYSDYFNIVDKIYKDMKTRVNILVEAIGKMHDDETIKIKLEEITDEINALVAKRDKCVGKIKEYETRIDIIVKDGVEDRERELIKSIKSDNKEIEKLREKISDIYLKMPTLKDLIEPMCVLSKIVTTIDDKKKQLKNIEVMASVLDNTILELKNTRNSISEDIATKEEILKDISTDYSLNELKKMLKEYKKRYDELDKEISKLDDNVTKNDFMIGYEIVSNVRAGIMSICENEHHLVVEVATDPNIRDQISLLDDLYVKRDEIRREKDSLLRSISDLNKDAELKEILEKRPHDCKIDDCPFIKNAQKWTLIEKDIIKFESEVDKLDKKIDKITDQIIDLEKKASIYNNIMNLWKYIETNMTIINKLPHNKKYSTLEQLLKSISKGSDLSGCDNFDEYIEVLESRDEYNDLRFKKIPMIENEIRILETQGKLISSSKDELCNLKTRLLQTEVSITENDQKLSAFKAQIEAIELIISVLEKFYSRRSEYDELCDNLNVSVSEIKEIRSRLDEMDKYKEKLKEKKLKLQDIDSALNPLTRERELYKMEQLKIADHKQELAAIEADMFKCEIVRASLSVKDDGIPVGALEFFMDTVRSNANALLSGAFNGRLYLEEFIINSKDFIIPYKKNGDRGMDVSFASSSERSFISLCLTLAIMEEIVSTYGIAILDEIDRGFSSDSKYKFIEILGSQVKRAGISQVFMVTHNSAFYEGYNIGYILFPGADISKVDDEDCVRIKND